MNGLLADECGRIHRNCRQPERSKRPLCSLLRILFPALLLLNFTFGRAQTPGSIAGVVRDARGVASPGVGLTLAMSNSPGASLHATTDKLGAFHFDRLAFGTYRLAPDRQGDFIAPNSPLIVSTAVTALHLDLVLNGASESSQKPPSLQLQAAGIRGYIDPGGYSAPAGAAAASNVLQGAASLNRPDNAAGRDVDASCLHQPVLIKAVLDHPKDPAAHRRLGEYYLVQHQSEKALNELHYAHALDEHDDATLVALAEALLQEKQFSAAHDLLMADAAVVNQASTHRLLARSEEGLGNFQQAAAEYQAAAAFEPTEADLYGAGYELILAGSPGDAVKIFESGSARYPESTTLLMGIATADFLQGQSAEATRIFLRCATLHPDDARLYPFLSASFAISGVEPDAVEASFQRYYQLHSNSADAAYFYALALMHKNPLQAVTLLQRAIQLKPDFAKAHLQLGSVYFDRGTYTHAVEEFAAALRLDPGRWETHYRLSMAYRHTGETGLADQQMQLFLAHKNQNVAAAQPADLNIEKFLSVFANPGTNSIATGPCTGPK